MADGAGETALLIEGNSLGIKVWEDEDMVAAFDMVDEVGYQIHVHTIGDGAVKYTLDALEQVQDIDTKRHSLAHVEMARAEDVTRMSEFGLYSHMTQS